VENGHAGAELGFARKLVGRQPIRFLLDLVLPGVEIGQGSIDAGGVFCGRSHLVAEGLLLLVFPFEGLVAELLELAVERREASGERLDLVLLPAAEGAQGRVELLVHVARGRCEPRREHADQHAVEIPVAGPLQDHDLLGIAQLGNRLLLQPTEVLALRVELAVAGAELDARLLGIGVGLGANPLAEQRAAVGQSDASDRRRPEHAQSVGEDDHDQDHSQREHGGQGGAGGPDQRLALPPEALAAAGPV